MIPDKGAAINGRSSGYYDLSTLERAHKKSYIKIHHFYISGMQLAII
jgi:hypothetical protein